MPRALPILTIVFAVALAGTAGPGQAQGLPHGVERISLAVGELTFDAIAAGPTDGELVLLLHGFPETSFAFRHQVTALGALGYRAVAPDQRGYSPGARPAGVAAYAMTNLVADVFGMADALGRDTFHLVGHDWGAAVAWVAATVNPRRVESLSILSTPHYAALSAARADPSSEQSTRSAYFDVFSAPGAEEQFLADDAAYLRSVYGDLDHEAVTEYMKALGNREALRAALAWYAAAFGGSTGGGARSSGSAGGTVSSGPPATPGPVTVPTLYVWSTDDSAFARSAAEATRAYVTGPYRFVVIEGVDHWVAERVPEQVTELIVQQIGTDVRWEAIPGTSLGFTMARVPGGAFSMGSVPDEEGRDEDEGPVRVVQVSPFWMAVHELTQELYGPFRNRQLDDDVGYDDEVAFDADAVSRPSPPYEDPMHGMGGDDLPAVGMTRLAALRYAHWLSVKTGRLYRLPTEAEWEFACRGGGETTFGFGSDGSGYADHAWLAGNSRGVLHPVGTRTPGRWGLHDMHGNAAEWVMDGYREYAAQEQGGVVENPLLGSPTRGRGVVRGGSFDDEPTRARCAERFEETPAWKRRDPQIPKSRWWNTDSPHVGFRLVRPDRDYTLAEIEAFWAEVLGGA